MSIGIHIRTDSIGIHIGIHIGIDSGSLRDEKNWQFVC